VGEAFPFSEQSVYALAEDSHNSLNGVRMFASQAGARTCYIAAGPTGGLNKMDAEACLPFGCCLMTANEIYKNVLRQSASSGPSLFALTGQSNVSNHKLPLSLLSYASRLGYHTLLDAAALAPTSRIDLTATPVDAMAISFYKMFGYPTGVGALIAKKSFLLKLKRPWFAGEFVRGT
jgi:molybdenum cofactor sulfurtransferase